jgi:perosamine synthetase
MYKDFVDFVRQKYPNQDCVPLHAPVFIGNEKKYVTECIDTTFVSSVGNFVDRFEYMVKEYTKAKSAVVCVNGTNALYISLMLVGVERNDEVLTQALTFIATCNAISYIGAKPVFIDVDKETLGLSPKSLTSWLDNNAEVVHFECRNKTSKRRIRACVPVHTFGHPCRIDEIVEICEKWKIELVEDAAESIGSFYKCKHTGTFGKVGALSFNGNKTITTGGGGMMLFQDEKLGKLAKHLTTQAKIPNRWEFKHDLIGYNFRMPNINAALGCAQMEHIEKYIINKRETAKLYAEFFKYQPDMSYFIEPKGCRSNYWLNVIMMKDKTTQEQFLEYTNNHSVMTRPVWELMSRLKMFDDCQTDGLENTKWLSDRLINIPSSVRF